MTDQQFRSLDPDSEAVRAEFEWTLTSPAIAVVETVSEACDLDPRDVAPLYETIDPDALDALVGSGLDELRDDELRVSFTYEGQRVTVTRAGEVVVRPLDGGR